MTTGDLLEGNNMAQVPFDASKVVTFNLVQGEVQVAQGARCVLTPLGPLQGLCAAAGEVAAVAFGKGVGELIGARVASRLGGSSGLMSATLESVTEQLAGELAVAGWGIVSLESWGRALIVRLQGGGWSASGSKVAGAVLQGALHRATGRPLSCVLVEEEGEALRFLVIGSGGAQKARALLDRGLSWGDVVVQLQLGTRGEA